MPLKLELARHVRSCATRKYAAPPTSQAYIPLSLSSLVVASPQMVPVQIVVPFGTIKIPSQIPDSFCSFSRLRVEAPIPFFPCKTSQAKYCIND